MASELGLSEEELVRTLDAHLDSTNLRAQVQRELDGLVCIVSHTLDRRGDGDNTDVVTGVGHGTLRAIRLGRLFRIPVDGKPISIVDLSAIPSEILNVVV